MKTNNKNQQLFTAYDDAIFSWEAPEYIHHEKGLLWKIIIPGIWLAFVVYGFATEAWTFTIALLVFAGVYVLMYHEKPKRISIVISKTGVKVGNLAIPYSHMRAFWIHYQPPFLKHLQIRSTRGFSPDCVIPLEDQDPVEIRAYLVSQVPEWEGKEESFSEVFVRLLKL